MKEITIKKIPFKLRGETIKEGATLEFKALNLKKEVVKIKKSEGKKVISCFPDINTSICDFQTKHIQELVKEFPELAFYSISTDGIRELKKWCLANNIEDTNILSDKKYREFGLETNILITRIDKLARAFFVLDENNKILKIFMKREVSEHPDYDRIRKFLKTL